MKRKAVFVAALALTPAFTAAEVLDSAPNGFTVKTTLVIHAAPDEVYRRIVRNVGDWWNPRHTFSQDSHNLSMEEKVQGCFCEKLPGRGSVALCVIGPRRHSPGPGGPARRSGSGGGGCA